MNYLERLVERYPALDGMKDTIEEAFQIMKASYENGGKLLVCGNGGSASDSDHIVGELMKGCLLYTSWNAAGIRRKTDGLKSPLMKKQAIFLPFTRKMTVPNISAVRRPCLW